MTLIALSIYLASPEELPDALDRAAAAASRGARLIEWRCDSIASDERAAAFIGQLVEQSPVPSIVTIRPDYEGGQYDGDEQHRRELLLQLAQHDAPPRYLDVELAAVVSQPQWRNELAHAVDNDTRDIKTSVILSSHDFDRRPADLLQRIEAMTNADTCAVLKVAWHARSLRDNLELFDLLLARQKPTIALCMGPFGLMSRVLAPKFGGFLTFVTDSHESATAPGQPTVEDLRETYRFDAIARTTQVYGVIGWPIEQSRSPHIHNAGFSAVNYDGVLIPMPIPPEYEHFKATVGAMLDHAPLDFRGAAVTIPHKENLLRFVRERGGKCDELTDRIGAANTLIVEKDGSIGCTNTDCPAAIDALVAGMEISPEQLRNKHVAVLGAGGAARAVVAGLSDAGATITVLNRDAAKAARLMNELQVQRAASDDRIDIVINCTPIGMVSGPDPDGVPLHVDAARPVQLHHTMTVFDTVYHPQRTPLLVAAEHAGARIITGREMFLRQAALQFEHWTGSQAPVDVFTHAFARHRAV
jgi:3-dehydroquinate dehydratase/shikimate dehydrogenase